MASKCSSFYHQSGLGTLLPFPNGLRFYSLKTKPGKPNIQHRQEIRRQKELLASKCSSFFHQFGLGTLPPFSNALKFYSLRTKSNIQHRQEIRSENQSTCFFERELSAPKCSSFYHKSGLETLVTVGAVIERAQVLRTQNIPNIQHRHEIRSENQVLALKENHWRLNVRRSTIEALIPLPNAPMFYLLKKIQDSTLTEN